MQALRGRAAQTIASANVSARQTVRVVVVGKRAQEVACKAFGGMESDTLIIGGAVGGLIKFLRWPLLDAHCPPSLASGRQSCAERTAARNLWQLCDWCTGMHLAWTPSSNDLLQTSSLLTAHLMYALSIQLGLGYFDWCAA